MKLDTALNKTTQAVTRSIDAISAARSYGSLSSALHETLRAIIANMGKAPQWARSYVTGYQDCMTKALYQTDLVFGGYVNGAFFSVHRSRADYYESNGYSPKEWHDLATQKGHYWSETATATGHPLRGLKPFFISDTINR